LASTSRVCSPSCENTIVLVDADDGQRAAPAREPAQHQLAADRAQRLDLGRERLVGGDQLRRQPGLAFLQIRIGKLTRQHLLDVLFAHQAEAHRRLAEADPGFLLHAQHAFGIFRVELAGFEQERTHAHFGGALGADGG
jgi:hypothetical protein